jgi:hypothetical protein
VREAIVELGATDARTVKLLARPGMGWCQGRICGMATATLAARLGSGGAGAGDAEAIARRAIAQPVPLGAVAALDERRSGEGRGAGA